ncbi:hypothetical protein PIB30_034986 [Stylosanthes scabra]|uniref:Uncharacterized protein n=1 Tax=Stylosanthes scabra TaxID=79078 RepID=A0ABU6QEA7_9FABA|nr:hypothetical protein [Stylosanthes scabra]
MGSGVVYYEYEAHEEYNDIDVKATAELGTIKIRGYHFKDEKFTRSVHSGRFVPDRPYEFPIAMLGRGGTFGEFKPTPSAQTYPPYRRHIFRVPKRSTSTPNYSPLSRSWMGEGDVGMEDNEERRIMRRRRSQNPRRTPKRIDEPNIDGLGGKNPKEDREKSKEESELNSMGASTESEFLRLLTSGQQLVYSSFGSFPYITSQNLD